MKKIFFFLTFFISTTLLAQNKLLTMEDAMVKNRSTLAVENLKQLQFVFGTTDYVYLKKIEGKEVWVKGNIKTAEAPFLTLEQLNDKLKTSNYGELKTMPAIQFNVSTDWILNANGNKIALNPVTNQTKELIKSTLADKTAVEESSAGFVAYVENNNLFVSSGFYGTKQVTKDGSANIVYAQSVHRDEFGISKGTFWSNNGKSLAYYRMDQSMVTDYPIIDWTTYPAVNKNIKYPMAGGQSHYVTVGIYNAIINSTTWIRTGIPTDQYLTNIAWSPDDKWLYIAVLNREQNHMKLNQYNANTGELTKTLFEEKDEKYVEPLVPLLFVKNKPDQFIWQSNRDGWNHLYLYNADGTLIKQLTKGNWEVLEVKGFDAKGENLFYTATEESPVTKNLYQLNLKTGQSKRVTTATGVHTAQVSTDGSAIIDAFSTTDNPRTILVTEIKTAKSKQLLQAANPIADYAMGKLSIFTIKNATGTDLYCRMFKPVNFDSTKKYPVIVYWYGGPHAQMILNGWNGGAGDYWFQYMAEHGYVVFTLDTRGSDNRGKAFEQTIFRRAGEAQMEDLMSGVDYLSSLSYVDKNNMGLFGWSYGGFMTTDFVLHHPGVFKAAVAGGPVMDWKYYEIMYGERYMDTPQENPDGYEATNLIKQAGKLKDKLLLIHGLQDPVVVQQHSVNFVKACVDAGVQVDYMIYPGHEHNVLGKDRAHLYQKVTDYFMNNLVR
ncbi:DPP IV N-terminal domain-containing protein [Ferruginibacter sp. SUN106]|uniref:S9 family peptidase n=1 Tax=Ferruginibacter sp. SUN106 TaxID=2978348 RepID=UPI003D369057